MIISSTSKFLEINLYALSTKLKFPNDLIFLFFKPFDPDLAGISANNFIFRLKQSDLKAHHILKEVVLIKLVMQYIH